MNSCYLEITYRKGRPLAAYYYLPRRNGDRVARTERVTDCYVVDYADDGRPIGVEITAPRSANVDELRALVQRLGYDPASPDEFAPLVAA